MEIQRTSDLSKQLLALRGSVVEGLRSVPHSLQTVAVVNGVEYVDDSRSTFLDAAMAPALDKRIMESMREQVEVIVFYGGLDQARADELEAEWGCVYTAGDLRTAVFTARELATPGGIVLFSPACPCGVGAANHAERGAEFKRAVLDL
jgi:UDP-N-acetylmuramoylalanine--D-glutamate ligase